MRIILTANVNGVGRKGDEKDVSDGHARNFLVPRGLAVPATVGAARNIAEARQSERNRDKKARSRVREAARLLRREPLVFTEKVTPAGKLYSAVSAKMIGDRVGELTGVAGAKVELDRPLKEPGEHKVRIILDDKTVADAICVIRLSDD